MRKTVSITINGQLFHIEEQGYKKLDEYLDAIRTHFSTYEDRLEIIADIEARIAEHFNEKLTKSRNVIAQSDVDELIAQMGTVKDFKEFEDDHESDEKAEHGYEPGKRLYRDTEHQIIAGVCAGIANYFGIDPTIVRLLFGLSLIFGGAGVLAYIVLWVVMPEAKTSSEKVEMHGQPLTLKRIEKVIREKVPEAAQKMKPGKFGRVLRLPFVLLGNFLRLIGKIISTVVPAFGRIIGLLLTIVFTAALFGLVFIMIMLAIHAWEPYMDIPLRELAGNFTFYLLLFSGFYVIFVPLLLLFLAAISLMIRRNVFSSALVITFVAQWIVALMVGAVTMGKQLPQLVQNVEQYRVVHEHEASKTFTVPPFTSLNIGGGYTVQVRKGKTQSVTMTGTEHSVSEATVSVQDGTLVIDRSFQNRFCIVCLGNNATVNLVVPTDLANIDAHTGTDIDLDGINLTGDHVTSNGGTSVLVRHAKMPKTLSTQAMGGARIDIEASDPIEALQILATAGSRVTYSGIVKTTDVKQHAGSVVELVGSGSTLKGEVTSGSDLHAQLFTVDDATLDLSAGASAEIHARKSIHGSAHAGSSIRYTGTPETIDVDTDPSGRVEQIDHEDSSDF
jgi:phage shock protein PspC (stress-responsive transcriptional regulator)